MIDAGLKNTTVTAVLIGADGPQILTSSPHWEPR